MNTLFVDKRGIELKVDSNALTVYQDKTRINTVPLAPLKRILFRVMCNLGASVLAVGEYQIGVGGAVWPQSRAYPTHAHDWQRCNAVRQ